MTDSKTSIAHTYTRITEIAVVNRKGTPNGPRTSHKSLHLGLFDLSYIIAIATKIMATFCLYRRIVRRKEKYYKKSNVPKVG